MSVPNSNSAVFEFGTTEPANPRRTVRAGPVSAIIEGGALRTIRFQGVEVLRQIDFPIRDENWATATPTITRETLNQSEDSFTFEQQFDIEGGALQCRVIYHGQADGTVTATGEARATRDFNTNRSGFTVLHPITGVAGQPVTVTSPEGEKSQAKMPEAISPDQPIKNIAGLSFDIEGVTLDMTFAGEVFEMEDQRNWSDASYKTYCRPLVEPFTYTIAKGDSIRHEIVLRLSGAPPSRSSKAGATVEISDHLYESLPKFLLAAETGWMPDAAQSALLAQAGLSDVLLRVTPDTAAPLLDQAKAMLAVTGGKLNLEILLSDTGDLDAQMAAVSVACAKVNVVPTHVMALPAAFLQSYQPTGSWPKGAQPQDAIDAARRAFTDSLIGSGMLTNFTEFNRCRPDAIAGDYITHGNSATVHAADDNSVTETLEALPDIFASARGIGGDVPYRLGLSAIGMRTNPYGAAVSANPDQNRLTMATWDPRARGLFGAAWAVGAIASTCCANVEAITLAAPVGPFGVLATPGPVARPWYDDTPTAQFYPIYHVLSFLAACTGTRLRVSGLPDGVAAVAAKGPMGSRAIIANVSGAPLTLPIPGADRFALLDTDSFAAAAHDPTWSVSALAETPPAEFSLTSSAMVFLELKDLPKS